MARKAKRPVKKKVSAKRPVKKKVSAKKVRQEENLYC
jgi:hypothetical protein